MLTSCLHLLQAAAKQVRALSTAQGVDYLINNAGVLTGAGKTRDE